MTKGYRQLELEDTLLSPPVSLVAWNNLGMDEDTWLHVFRETELQFEEISQALAL
jgi:hypothetical protein